MESNWRFNIAFLGMTGLGWELCARVLSAFPAPLYVVKESPTKFGLWSELGHFDGLVHRIGGQQNIPTGVSFPYGLPVEPD